MSEGRILHALPYVGKGTKRWELIYKPVAPINMLVSYAYLRGKTISQAVERLEDMLPLFEGKVLAIDCGVYTLKGQFGLTAQAKDTSLQYDAIRGSALERWDEFVSYVTEYGEFLRATYSLYTYSFDFDADPLIGSAKSDELSQILFDTVGGCIDKVARVYHIARENATDWWHRVCMDKSFKFVAIEGGQMHRNTLGLYHRLISVAHQYGKKTHILAISGDSFPKEVPTDYMDCTTHTMGGQKALIQTPWGTFQAGRYMSQRHILSQPQEVQEATREFVGKYGFTLEQLMDPNPDAQYYRQQLSIFFINDYWDVPYVVKSSMESLF